VKSVLGWILFVVEMQDEGKLQELRDLRFSSPWPRRRASVAKVGASGHIYGYDAAGHQLFALYALE
jgi:hypothetical protein